MTDRERAREIAMRYTREHWRDRGVWNEKLSEEIFAAIAAVRAETVERIKALTDALEDAVDTLEAMDMHIDNPLYERLRAILETGDTNV